ncbi:Hpt domain-containing protein [Sulfurovum sp. NBC37-1]|uniref:Hpt domain-containing protein n=1 Tax=Sulfurovum sp. (strain NBC37-1) TaxID=387093 RepID=UPI0001587C11|nr:Hpt domain-containing protein [Sulfurovum sp. NBC37-1]BAF72850.1 hypothetical protein SUN_1903 [Sulfurovum sp. NBC37-1]
MYYITNQNGQIIAASNDLLISLEVKSIDILYKQIALDAIELIPDSDSITIKTPLNEIHYKMEKETLSSILGTMTLIHITTESSTKNTLEEEILSVDKEIPKDDSLLLDDEVLFDVKEEPEEEKSEITSKAETTVEDLENEVLFGVKEESEEEKSEITSKAETVEDHDELFDLILPSKTEETINKIDNPEVSEKTSEPIYIDVDKISQSIGISSDDYNTFLTEYIDTALSLEKDLRSDEKNKRTAASHTLFHLSNVLRLPIVTDIIEQLKYTEAEDSESIIQDYYNTLSRLTIVIPETETAETKVSVAREESKPEHLKSFGTIDLSDVKPVHFDFQVGEAANELSLPAELIEEFIHDFIKQAHEETDKMLKAYEKGDLETIQKIGHLLKGTASNLRINPLADTLYEIQFCNDSSQLEQLIKEYWAHFLAFETQFKLTSNKGN